MGNKMVSLFSFIMHFAWFHIIPNHMQGLKYSRLNQKEKNLNWNTDIFILNFESFHALFVLHSKTNSPAHQNHILCKTYDSLP
jgi:hypothetical protein